MTSHRSIALMALAFGLAAAVPATAAVVYAEPVQGDFSDDRAAPTVLTILLGQNDVFGVTGQSVEGMNDRDYFTFTISPGNVFKSLTVLDSSISAGGGAFMGLQSGGQVTVDPVAPTPEPLLGYAIVSPADIGSDILPRMSTAGGAIGFTTPLGAGQYSLWIQDTNIGPSVYGLQIEVAPIPVPASAPLVLTCLAALAWCGRRRSGSAAPGTRL